MTVPVRLVIGDSKILLDPGLNMASVRSIAAAKLKCQPELVVMHVQDPDDATWWEIQGEAVFADMVLRKQTISASKRESRKKAASRPSSSESEGRQRTRKRRTSSKESGTPGQTSQTSSGPHAVVPGASRTTQAERSRSRQQSATHTQISRSRNGNGTTHTTSPQEARSSRKTWLAKEDNKLWKCLQEELQQSRGLEGGQTSVYSIEECDAIFARILEKHPRSFEGRTVSALKSRVRARVTAARARNDFVPANLTALFPVSRSSRAIRPTWVSNSTPSAIRSSPRTSTPSRRSGSVPVPQRRRRYDHDDVRVEVLPFSPDDPLSRPTNGQRVGTAQDSTDSSSSDESSSPSPVTRTQASPRVAINSFNPFAKIAAAVSSHDGPRADEAHQDSAPAQTSTHVDAPVRPISVKQEDGNTPPPAEQLSTAVHIPPLFAPCTPVRQQVQELVLNYVEQAYERIGATATADHGEEDWKRRWAEQLTQESLRFEEKHAALPLGVEVSREILVRGWERWQSSKESCASAIEAMLLFLPFHEHFLQHDASLERALCRDLHGFIFAYEGEETGREDTNPSSEPSKYVHLAAAGAFLLPTRTLPSLLSGLFDQGWEDVANKSSPDEQAHTSLDIRQTEHVFLRMKALLKALHQVEYLLSQQKRPFSVRTRFHRNAFVRIFEQTHCSTPSLWQNGQLFGVSTCISL